MKLELTTLPRIFIRVVCRLNFPKDLRTQFLFPTPRINGNEGLEHPLCHLDGCSESNAK